MTDVPPSGRVSHIREESHNMMQTDSGRTTLETTEMPVACTLGVKDQATRRDAIARLFEGRQQVRELPDGYAVRFAGDDNVAVGLLHFISGERVCCPFFTFELTFETRRGPIWLRLRGPEGTKGVVAELLDV